MKTIEEQAKAYNTALEMAREAFYSPETPHFAKAWLLTMFPTIAENKDEKMRKALYADIRTYIPYEEAQKYIAWLEKQAEIDLEHYKDGENEKRKFVGYGFLKCRGDFLSFKEGETYWLEYIGKDNYNVRSDNLLGQTFHIKPVELYTVFRPTTWLEKQGERNFDYEHADIPQKDFAPIEPKFKVGDWVVLPLGIIAHVDSLNSTDYQVTTTDGKICDFKISKQDNYHLWTIADAKDGDVVVDKSDGTIGIFKSIGHHPDGGSYNDPSYCFLHCRYDDGFFYADFEQGNTINSDDLIPATKEQRNLLFQTMVDAGYEWDSKKKELKKIESKTLDAAKVIEWLDEHVPTKFEDMTNYVQQFKKDFDL